MEARTIAKQVAYSRIAMGVALIITPKTVARRWVGPVAGTPGGRVLSMTFGARDLAVGAGAAYALGSGASARPWLLAAAFCDAADATATFAARRELPSLGALGTVALASVTAAVGLWTARELT